MKIFNIWPLSTVEVKWGGQYLILIDARFSGKLAEKVKIVSLSVKFQGHHVTQPSLYYVGKNEKTDLSSIS